MDSILTEGDRAPGLSRSVSALRTAVTSLTALDCLTLPQAAARDLSVSLAHVYIGALLVEQAVHSQHPGDVVAAGDWWRINLPEKRLVLGAVLHLNKMIESLCNT